MAQIFRYHTQKTTMKFRPYDNTQGMMFPPMLEDFIPPGHLVRAIDTIVEQLNLVDLYASYSEEGQPGYHPKMLLKLLLYGYATGVRSSRKIAQKLESDVCFMFLSALQRPDFRTISDFRMEKRAFLEECFLQVLRLCQTMGMVALGHIAIDGTKLRGSASRHRMKDREWVLAVEQQLSEQVKSLLETAQETDSDEDQTYGKEYRGDELPEEVQQKERLLKRLQQAKHVMEELDLQRVHITDPDTRLMLAPGEGTQVCYNSQIAVDAAHQIIVGCTVTSEEQDRHQFIPMYEQTIKNTAEIPKEVSADAGYQTGAVYVYLEQHNIDAYLPDQKFVAESDAHGNESIPAYDRRRFHYDEQEQGYRCPENKLLRFMNQKKRYGVSFRIYKATECLHCRVRSDCITNPKAINREILFYESDKYKARMRGKLRSPEGKARYLKRLATVEPVFAQVKHNLGFRRFLVRGIEKVKAEFQLLCTAYNIKKLATFAVR